MSKQTQPPAADGQDEGHNGKAPAGTTTGVQVVEGDGNKHDGSDERRQHDGDDDDDRRDRRRDRDRDRDRGQRR